LGPEPPPCAPVAAGPPAAGDDEEACVWLRRSATCELVRGRGVPVLTTLEAV